MNETIKQRIAQLRNGEIPKGYITKHGYCFPISWSIRKLRDSFSRLSTKNNINCKNVLTISAQQGLISQQEYYHQSYASENTQGYSLLEKGDYAYNKSYSDGYPFGAIKRLDKYDQGVVSPLYICFSPNEDTNSDYYSHYFEAGVFNREIYSIAQEGARNHGLLNVAVEDFFGGSILCPPIEEQQKITEILAQCDKVITLKQELLDETRKQKKWLIENLLNPDSGVRLPGFTGSWINSRIKALAVVKNGGTPDTSDANCWGGNNLWCTPTDISSSGKYITSTQQTISDKGLRDSSAELLPIGTILMCSRATIGPRAIAKSPISTNQGFKNFICGNHLNNEFFYYYIDICLPDFLRMSAGNTFKEISKTCIENYVVRIPTITEQIAIANVLSIADKEIGLLEQELASWKEKKKGLAQLLLTGLVRV